MALEFNQLELSAWKVVTLFNLTSNLPPVEYLLSTHLNLQSIFDFSIVPVIAEVSQQPSEEFAACSSIEVNLSWYDSFLQLKECKRLVAWTSKHFPVDGSLQSSKKRSYGKTVLHLLGWCVAFVFQTCPPTILHERRNVWVRLLCLPNFHSRTGSSKPNLPSGDAANQQHR